MPAAVAVPAIVGAAGLVKGEVDRRRDQKQQQQQQQQRQISPQELAQQNQDYRQFLGSGYSPDQLQGFLGKTAWGTQIGPYQAANIDPYLSTNWGEVSRMQARTPQEAQALQALLGTGAASAQQAQQLQQFSVPQLEAVQKRNLALLGGNKAAATEAIAPQAAQIAEIQQGARRGLEAQSGLRGGARQQALAEQQRLAAGQIAGLIPQAQQQAQQQAGQLGMQGQQLAQGALGQAGSLFGAGQQAEAQNRQFGIGAEQANRQMALQALLGQSAQSLQARGQDIGSGQNILEALLQQRGQNLQAILGRMGVDTSRLGQTDQNYFNNRQLTNQSNQGLGQFLGGLYNIWQQHQYGTGA